MKVPERSSRVTRGSSGNRQSGQSTSGRNTRRSLSASGNERTSNAKKRKCAAEDKSPAKRNNIAPDPMPNIQRRQFRDRLGDAYCWICHKYADEFYCQDCPRVYHNDCLRKLKSNPDEPLCKCKWTSVDGLNSHNTNITSDIPELLSLCLHKIIGERTNKKQADANDYMRLLNSWPEECEKNDLICDNWDIKLLIDRIHIFSYKNPGGFFQDVKWLYHNSYICFGPDHERTTTALKFEKAIKQQLSDMEACGECYREKCVKFPHVDFFSRVCPNPHLIVWAKLKGFPFWPAKCLRVVNGHADVRFFGTHDKSLIPLAQVYKISRLNPGGNPKKPKNSSRMTSYDEAMAELNFYVENYEKQFGRFHFYNEKTLLEPVKKSGRRGRQSKNGNQLEVSMNTDADENEAEASYNFPVHRDSSLGQPLPLLNVSLLHDDPTETKAACRNVLNSSVVLEDLTTKTNVDLPQTSMESSVVCHMTFDEESHVETISDEGMEGTSSSHSQLPEIPVQVTVASVKGSPELCVNVPSSGILLNNAETSEVESNNYLNINVCDNSAAVPSTSSDSPLLITSTQSLSNIVSNAMGEISKINASESLNSEENIKRTFENLIGSHALPELLPGDDDEIQLVRENHADNLVGGIFKNQPMLKTFCELLLGNKPNIRNYIASFQNMALHFYLAMWLEANTGKLNSNECKMFHSIYEKLCKAVETLKVQVRALKTENEDLKEKLKQEKLAVSGKALLRERIVSAQVQKNNEDIVYFKNEIKRLLRELDDAKKFVNVFQDSKSKTEEELEQFKAKCDDLKVQKLEIEAQKKLKEEEIETLKKKKELDIEDLKKSKEEEIKNFKKWKEEEIESLKKQIKEQININTKKEKEIEVLKEEKIELESIKKDYEKEVQRKETEYQNFMKDKDSYLGIIGKSQDQTSQYTNIIMKLKDELQNCRCKSINNPNQSFVQTIMNIEETQTIERTEITLQSNKCSAQPPMVPPVFMCSAQPHMVPPMFMNPVSFGQQIANSSQALIRNLEINEEKEKEDEDADADEDEDEEKEEQEEEKEENKEEVEVDKEDEYDDDEENEEVYHEKDNADDEEEQAIDTIFESKSLVASKLRSSRNTVPKLSSSHKYSKTRARPAVKLIKKATKSQKKNVSKAVIRKRK